MPAVRTKSDIQHPKPGTADDDFGTWRTKIGMASDDSGIEHPKLGIGVDYFCTGHSTLGMASDDSGI